MLPITLTHEEELLLDDLNNFTPPNNNEEYKKAAQASKQMMKSLLLRKAIPDHRVKFFTDPEYNVGAVGAIKKSIQQGFERNGKKGEAIFEDPNFFKYLDYFINGPKLPYEVKVKSKEIVDSNTYKNDAAEELFDFLKTSSISPKLVLDKRTTADEVFKLALDLHFDLNNACRLRERYMSL
ncbi:hypothetical protein [Telluribacter sp. SYSU D00476]|uniref:hypothetical protein n=1 Tax=Telluribacter sp. SYSU D00476 TaxID=2811430 RepID=UPI001FF1825D|nr:hypothetical protein [Telluribacter sp. SYSU D00476]